MDRDLNCAKFVAAAPKWVGLLHRHFSTIKLKAQERLRQTSTDLERARRAGEVEETLEHLTRLSERLMQLARPKGTRLLTDPPQDLRPAPRIVARDFARGLDAGRVMLALPDATTPSDIDPDALAIVARNQTKNALRHGQGTVAVSLDSQGTLSVWRRIQSDRCISTFLNRARFNRRGPRRCC